jgi:WD40 repeat protein
MSAKLKHIYAGVPSTTRGKPVLMGGDPKGEKIVYTSGNTVVMRSLKEPVLAETYSEHQYPVTVARYAPSGFYMASADSTGTVRIWDTVGADRILKLEIKPISGAILDLCWSPDSKRIVVVGEGREKYGAAFFADSGASVGEITGHIKAITTCDMKQTRPYRVATGGEDFANSWFEGPPFKWKKSMKEHTRFVNCVRFTPDGNLWASAGQDKKVFLFEGKDGEKVGELSAEGAHGGGIYACSWSADGKRLLTASGDKTCKIWDAETRGLISTFSLGKDVEDQQVGCLWQGDYLVSLSLRGDLIYLDPNTGAPSQILRGHNKSINSIAYDKSTSTIYSAGVEGVVTSWDQSTAANRAFSGKPHGNHVVAVNVQRDSLITTSLDETVRTTPISSLQYGDSNKIGGLPQATAAGSLTDVLVVSTRETVEVLRGGKVVHKQDLPSSSVAISPDETTVVVGGKDNNLHVFELDGDTLKKVKAVSGHRGVINSIAFSADGSLVGSGDQNREVIAWDAKSWERKTSGWVYHNARVNSVAWSPDNRHLASGSLDSGIIVWDVQSPATRITIKNSHFGGTNSLVWLDESTICSAGQDGIMRTWTVTY